MIVVKMKRQRPTLAWRNRANRITLTKLRRLASHIFGRDDGGSWGWISREEAAQRAARRHSRVIDQINQEQAVLHAQERSILLEATSARPSLKARMIQVFRRIFGTRTVEVGNRDTWRLAPDLIVHTTRPVDPAKTERTYSKSL